MTAAASLASAPLVAFVPITDKDKALAFYRDQLGLTLLSDETPFALVFDLNGITLRATFVGEFKPQPFTILGWHVADIAGQIQSLLDAGVHFNRYPGMNDTHPLAIWTAPGGTQVAWLSDPFGNVLSLSQSPSA
ncbi:VOC family protein [Acidicapsa dinghuensis]|uniref:VOC family protein n=1 Tax=Acidicapsa dinghuensis TaxID=2218256 RepID=A0ABW1EKJ0_9BACT|nr:VOC family protein [Acidicapsa dinghuensis]